MKLRTIRMIAWLLLCAMLINDGGQGLTFWLSGFQIAVAETTEGSNTSGGAVDKTSGEASTVSGDSTTKEPATTTEQSGGGGGQTASGNARFDSLGLEAASSKIVYKSSLNMNDFFVLGYKKDASGDGVRIAVDQCEWSYEKQGNYVPIDDLTSSMGKKKVKVLYPKKEQLASGEAQLEAVKEIQVVPAKVTGFKQTAAGTQKDAYGKVTYDMDFTWDVVEGATGYQIAMFNEKTQSWDKWVKGGPTSNKINTNQTTVYSLNPEELTVNTQYEFKVRSFYKGEDGVTVYSDMTDIVKVTTAPDVVTGVMVTDYSYDHIEIKWDVTKDANGYQVYRRASDEADYKKIATVVDGTKYLDDMLTPNTTYYYYVKAFSLNEDFLGTKSDNLKCSTAPTATVVTLKSGDKKARITWKKITGSTGYQVYLRKTGEDNYTMVADVKQGTYNYTRAGMVNNVSYDVVVRAYRTVDGISYYSVNSAVKTVIPKKVTATSKKAKLYKTKKKFLASNACKNIGWFRRNVVYKKSFAMPGTINTNVGGFTSYRMCPQAITFAGSYLLMTAYDYAKEENSVIYVMNKSNGKLLTTIVLPDQVHVGGIAYDGTNVWVSHGGNVAAIRFSTIKSAAKQKKAYKNVTYTTLCKVKTTASFITYYKGMLWVGQTKETAKSPTYSYTISNKAGTPTLKAKNKINLPDRIQGIAFLPDGSLAISRSNLYMTSQRYYISQMDYYKPKWSGNKIKKLRKKVNTCQMPTMNEGIAVSGNYIYSCFESTVFPTASNPMDRICAFKTSSLTKKDKK